MKIGETVENLPEGIKYSGSKYHHIWEAVIAANGKWVAIECDDRNELLHIQMAATSSRGFRGQTRSRNMTLYIRVGPEEK
jgi:hypothetical protein